jgi:hypothetical protein
MLNGRLRAQLGRSLALVRCILNPGHKANRSMRVRKVPQAAVSGCKNLPRLEAGPATAC